MMNYLHIGLYGPIPGEPIHHGGLKDIIGDAFVHQGAASRWEVLQAIPPGCCTLYLIGHRGGCGNEGGIITYPGDGRGDKDKDKIPIINYDEDRLDGALSTMLFGFSLKHKFFSGSCPCKECVINIMTCGGDNLEQGREWRRRFARDTGCTVCGSLNSPYLEHDFLIDAYYPLKTQWQPDCVSPPSSAGEETAVHVN